MKRIRRLLIGLTASAVALSFTGCERKGPFEKAGDSIDKAGRKVEDKVKDASN